MKGRLRNLLRVYDRLYAALNKALIFKSSAQRSHDFIIKLLRFLERLPGAVPVAQALHHLFWQESPVYVGGVNLSHALILAAGLVKGDGFSSEEAALRAVHSKRNIIPGWQVIPALLGPSEFGSFTRFPRMGNENTVLWRHAQTRSTQNRVGLKNPGARAAALFLAQRKDRLPDEFGINIAVSPGLQDINQQEREVVEALQCFLHQGVLPAWFTLNLSCPNTEDDPLGHQLEAETRRLCGAFMACLEAHDLAIPLWVKISPGLAREQYRALLRICCDLGVQAIVATNTLPHASPDDPEQIAGMGGGELFASALAAVKILRQESARSQAGIDIIACGGLLDGVSFQAYREQGVKAAQYWSALVYRGPLAPALIESELARHEYEYEAAHRESLA